MVTGAERQGAGVCGSGRGAVRPRTRGRGLSGAWSAVCIHQMIAQTALPKCHNSPAYTRPYLPIRPLSIRWGDPAARPVRALRARFLSARARGARGGGNTLSPRRCSPAPRPSPRECNCERGLLPPSSSSLAGGGGVGLGCPRRNRINAPKISGQCASAGRAGWETMPSFHPSPQRQPAACLRCYPAPPSLGSPRRGDGTKIPRF